MAKLVGEAFSSLQAEPIPQRRIGRQPANSRGQPLDALCWNEQAGFVGDDDLARAVDVVADHRFAGNERLRQRAGQPFAQAGVNNDVHGADQRGNLLGRNQTGELKVRVEMRAMDLSADLLREDPVADEQKPHVGLDDNDPLRRPHDVRVAFEMKQPGDLSDDHVLVAIAELAAHRRPLFVGVQERLDLHAAVDGRELFTLGDAGVDEQIGHRFGHAHQRMAAPRGVAFAGAKNRPRPPALIRMKRRTVHRVHDRGNP